MINSPCRDCEDRWVTNHTSCHSSCERYLSWKEQNDKLKKEKNKSKDCMKGLHRSRRNHYAQAKAIKRYYDERT